MISANEALQQLRDGNARYVAGDPDAAARDHRGRRERTAQGQHPIAAILSCADSRVPVEMVFDQGIGDLFVVRVAGNVVGRSQAASIEFAASHLGVRLVVVLGHTDCGAVKGVVDRLGNPGGESSASLDFFVDKIRPSVERVVAGDDEQTPEQVVAKSVRQNVRNGVAALLGESEVIRSLGDNDGLLVTGAEYSLQTGIVEFL